MIINEIFKNDLSRRIKEVIKVDDPDELAAAEEIEDYWVTEHIEQEFLTVLDVYQESILVPTEEVNVWVSGFFGSGKSSFAKVLGYVLANPHLGESSAVEIFTSKLASDRIKALLNKIHEQTRTLSVFIDLASGRTLLKEGESVVLPLYRELLSQLDYSREPRLADLEFTLEGDEKLDEFERMFVEANPGKVWKERRHRALAANEASAAMHLLDPSVYNEPDSWAKGSQQFPDITANSFAKRALELLERRRPDHSRIMFIVDEVGQYVATDVGRMLDLQGVAQAFQKEDGRLWLTATSQETLEDVVSALAGKRVELARVQDRFPIRVDLITADIEEVVAHRVLAKTSDGAAATRSLYDANRNKLIANTTLDASPLGKEYTGDEFVTFYPLLPYQIPLFIRAVSAHRARGGAGPMFGGTNRTMIRLAQQLIINEQTDLGSRDLGMLATSAMAYDLLQGIVPGPWRFEIDQVEANHGEDSVEAATAKTVALLSGVPQVPLRSKNIGALLHRSVEAEALDSSVADAVEALQTDEVLRESEDGLRLQSPEEKDWEKRRRGIDLKTGQFRRLVRDSLSDLLSGVTASAAREFKLGISFDDERITDGDISVPILEGGEDQLNRAVRLSRESAHESDIFIIFERSDKTWRLAEELHRSNEMIREAETRSRTGDENSLLHEERKRAERLKHDFDRSLSTDIVSGKAIFQGSEEDLTGNDARSAVAASATDRVGKIYTHLDDWAAPVKRTYALSILKEDDLSGLPDQLGQTGLGITKVTPAGHVIDTEGPAISALLQEVQRRKSFGQEISGRYLEGHFGEAPYGGDIDVIMIVTAAAMRAGEIEIMSDGARLRSYTDARLENVFKNLPKFRAAGVLPRGDGPDVEAKTRVARLIDELTGERTPIVTDQLAAAIVKGLAEDRERVFRFTATLQGAGLNVPSSIETANRVLARTVNEDDEERIGSVDAARLDIKEGVIAARKLDDLLADDGGLELLRSAKRIVVSPPHDLSDASLERVSEIQEILDSANYVGGFAEIKSAVEGITEERREVWQDAYRSLQEVHENAHAEVEALTKDLAEADQAELIRRLEPLKPDDDWAFETGPSIDRINALAGGFPRMVDLIRRESVAGSGVEVVQTKSSQIYPHAVKTEEDLDALLAAIRAAADAALGDGKYFQLS